jgi:hypothetical protein
MEREPTPEWLERESSLDEVYMACLGWFVHAFASTEAMLFRLLVAHAGLTAAEGASVFSGVRMKPAMDSLNRLLEARGMTAEKETLARPFNQLSLISAVRDDILHHGTQEDDLGSLYVSNAERKHLPERATTRAVSTIDLMRMFRDLQEIEVHLVAGMLRASGHRREARRYFQRLSEPWLYKPPSPPPRQDKPRPPRQARTNPPRSSRAKSDPQK